MNTDVIPAEIALAHRAILSEEGITRALAALEAASVLMQIIPSQLK
jgi:DNA-binding GntR family transcriptional regulator